MIRVRVKFEQFDVAWDISLGVVRSSVVPCGV